jgi:hypothetical protein
MKKKKAKLRENIKNGPKSRHNSQKNTNRRDPQSRANSINRSSEETVDQSLQVMSHVIWDFAGPLLKTCNDEAAERKAVSLAIFVWNATLLPEQERTQTLETYLSECGKVLPSEELKTLSGYVDQLVDSKKTRFAHNRKKITNCTFGNFGDNRHIEVGYTME